MWLCTSTLDFLSHALCIQTITLDALIQQITAFLKTDGNIFKNIFQLTRTKKKSNLLNLWILKNIKFCWWLNAGISFLNIVSIKSLLESNDQLNMTQVTIVQGLITEH